MWQAKPRLHKHPAFSVSKRPNANGVCASLLLVRLIVFFFGGFCSFLDRGSDFFDFVAAVPEEFDRSVWGFTSIASAVWLFKRENVRAAHLDGLLFPFGPQTDNPRIYRLSAVGP